MTRLYRKVYLYAFGILLASLLLAGLALGALVGQRERGMVQSVFRRQVIFIRATVGRLERRRPESIPQRLKELSDQLGWDIVYWRHGRLVYSSIPEPPSFNRLSLPPPGRRSEIYWRRFRSPEVVQDLRPRQPGSAVLWMKLNFTAFHGPLRGILLSLGLILAFLAILIIPLIRYLLRPYQDLQQSIEHLSNGDFEPRLDAEKYPAFQELVSSFNHMQARLQKLLHQKQRLVADVSHELRSPLTRMRLALELLNEKDLADEGLVKRAIGDIQELDQIIDDVLEISRLQLHDMPLKKEDVNLVLVLFEVVEQFQDLLEQQGLSLDVEMPDDNVMLRVDPRLMKRLWVNLFSNLSKYVPGPGQVDLSLVQQEESIRMRLRDRGPGISPEALPHIFTPFYREDRSRSRRTGGVGLGLAIVGEIAHAHGGEIRATLPDDGEGGVCFELSLPLDEA